MTTPREYDAVLGGNTYQSVRLEFLANPQDCFFKLTNDFNLAGWAIAHINLPCSYGHKVFYLVRALTGETFWVDSCRISFRKRCPDFDFQKWQEFDWSQINELNKLPIDYRKSQNTSNSNSDF